MPETRARPIVAPEASGPPSMGYEFPVLDRSTFDNLTGFLAPDQIAAYVQAVAAQSEGLKLALGEWESPARLAEAAHTLAGSAGLMGFTRVSMLARRFEHGVMTCNAELPLLARGLTAAIELTLRDMKQLLPTPAPL